MLLKALSSVAFTAMVLHQAVATPLSLTYSKGGADTPQPLIEGLVASTAKIQKNDLSITLENIPSLEGIGNFKSGSIRGSYYDLQCEDGFSTTCYSITNHTINTVPFLCGGIEKTFTIPRIFLKTVDVNSIDYYQFHNVIMADLLVGIRACSDEDRPSFSQ